MLAGTEGRGLGLTRGTTHAVLSAILGGGYDIFFLFPAISVKSKESLAFLFGGESRS